MFSTQEIDMASNPALMLIKMRIMEKVWVFMDHLRQDMQQDIREDLLITGLDFPQGKISKGENYKHLPFVMLDYPANFSKKDIFACRTMFYWGNFVSATVHLQGKFKDQYAQRLTFHFRKAEHVFFCINHTPWEYTYDQRNYVLINQLSEKEIDDFSNESSFIKISINFPVEEILEAKEQIIGFYREVFSALGTK